MQIGLFEKGQRGMRFIFNASDFFNFGRRFMLRYCKVTYNTSK